MSKPVGSAPLRSSTISSAHAPALDLPARFMVVGMVIFAGLAAASPFTLPLLLGSFYDPRVLAFVHLNTLGVIAALILGASYQLIPVILQTPLASVRLGRLSFWCFLGGLIALPIGLGRVWPPALILGGTLLALAFGLYASVVVATLRRAPHRDVVAWHVAVATAGLIGGVAYGVILAANKGLGFLGEHTLANLAAHATLMLGGWVAVLLAGVAYRLVGMFTLAEDALWIPGVWLELGMTAGGAWLLSTSLHLGGPRTLNLLGAAALLGGLVLFFGQLTHLYRHRRRRGLDVYIPFALTAGASGLSATVLLVAGLVQGLSPGDSLWMAVGWLAIVGLAETAIQGFFYKISTFLVWLHRYAPLAGRQRVPKLDELYGRRLALTGWFLWTAGVTAQAVAILVGNPGLSRGAGVLLAVGLGCFLTNVIRIAKHWRAPAARNGHAGRTWWFRTAKPAAPSTATRSQ